jgi:adenylate cyclase
VSYTAVKNVGPPVSRYRKCRVCVRVCDRRKPPGARLSIAVLPFTNLNGDAAEDYFADGIVDNLTTDLSTHIAGLMVAGRGSAFSFKAKTFDPRQVGLSLGVRYLLQGSVRRTGDQVRVNAQLIEAETGTVIWAERFKGDSADLVSLQDQITAHIANSLGAALIRAGAQEAESRSGDPAAIDLVLRAQSAFCWATGRWRRSTRRKASTAKRSSSISKMPTR